MTGRSRVGHPLYGLLPVDVEGFDELEELALDLRSSWNHATDSVWRQLDPVLWDATHNPWGVLQTVSRDRIERASADPAFRKLVTDLVQARRRARGGAGVVPASVPALAAPMRGVLQHGVHAGRGTTYIFGRARQRKAASDLGVPVIGVGLLYSQGYFRETIDNDGTQQALFPYNDPGQLPVTPLRDENGSWLRQ
jgi:glycogen phosphorylase